MPNPVLAAAPGLPSATLTAVRWGQLHDMLTLALDALGDGQRISAPTFSPMLWCINSLPCVSPTGRCAAKG